MQEVKHIRITDRYIIAVSERKKLDILKIADKLSAKRMTYYFIFAYITGSNVILQVKWEYLEHNLR